MAHPDIVGPRANALSVILNAGYETLMDSALRSAYDADLRDFLRDGIGSFDGRPVSGWMGPEDEDRAVFVAENECIGCRQCTVSAPNTFFIEEDHGRARVAVQWSVTYRGMVYTIFDSEVSAFIHLFTWHFHVRKCYRLSAV